MKTIRIFIASPGDLSEERDVLSGIVIPELRRIFSNHEMVGNKRAISIDAVRWETHAWPAVGDDAQDVINREIGEYDILVGMMWKRFGTPTKRAASGTGEEFERAYQYYETYKRPNIMFYFRTTPFYTTGATDLKQFQKVVQFRKKLEKLGVLFWEFTSLIQFERDVREHLIRQIAQILRGPSTQAGASARRTAKAKATRPGIEEKPVKVFLVYGREDIDNVRYIYAAIREAGFQPWMDTEQLLPGQRWRDEIRRAISTADAILLLLSKHSVNRPGFLQKEIKDAMDIWAERPDDRPFLIPVRLEPTDMPDLLRELQWVDYFAEGGPERVMQALYSIRKGKREFGKSPKKSKSGGVDLS